MNFAYQNNPQEISEKIKRKLGCTETLSSCLKSKTTEQLLSVSQNNGHWPFGLYEKSGIGSLEDIHADLLIGFNTGDGFQWANDQYNRLNKHSFGIFYEPLELFEDILKNDFLTAEKRPPAVEIELLNLYLEGIDEDYRNQTILREKVVDFFTDEGFFYPIFRQSIDRDLLDFNTFVYKFDVESILTDIERPLMINSPRPKFAKAIRNDEADFIFKLSFQKILFTFYHLTTSL